jgi:hypothetical protein
MSPKAPSNTTQFAQIRSRFIDEGSLKKDSIVDLTDVACRPCLPWRSICECTRNRDKPMHIELMANQPRGISLATNDGFNRGFKLA